MFMQMLMSCFMFMHMLSDTSLYLCSQELSHLQFFCYSVWRNTASGANNVNCFIVWHNTASGAGVDTCAC